MNPEQVVQKQLEAYNQRDIKSFMAVIDEKVTFHDFSTEQNTLTGYEECKTYYTNLFNASPNLHSVIINRTVFGSTIIDHERITGRNDSNDFTELVLIYEVANEKIIRVTVLTKSP